MRSFYRLMLGKQSGQAEECFTGRFVGTNFSIHQDLTGQLPSESRAFNKHFIRVFLEQQPGDTHTFQRFSDRDEAS